RDSRYPAQSAGNARVVRTLQIGDCVALITAVDGRAEVDLRVRLGGEKRTVIARIRDTVPHVAKVGLSAQTDAVAAECEQVAVLVLSERRTQAGADNGGIVVENLRRARYSRRRAVG